MARAIKVAYLDASAIVKLYVREAHSEQLEKFHATLGKTACHEIGYVEVLAALAAAARSGRLKPEEHAGIGADFRKDWSASISEVGTDRALLLRAAELAEGFGLRGYDSVHLAAAERIKTAIGPELSFASFDARLNRAASLLGMSLPGFAIR